MAQSGIFHNRSRLGLKISKHSRFSYFKIINLCFKKCCTWTYHIRPHLEAPGHIRSYRTRVYCPLSGVVWCIGVTVIPCFKPITSNKATAQGQVVQKAINFIQDYRKFCEHFSDLAAEKSWNFL